MTIIALITEMIDVIGAECIKTKIVLNNYTRLSRAFFTTHVSFYTFKTLNMVT